jgi:hypothetical protein
MILKFEMFLATKAAPFFFPLYPNHVFYYWLTFHPEKGGKNFWEMSMNFYSASHSTRQ